LLAWHPRLLKGAWQEPKRSVVGLVILSLFTVANFAFGWKYGVEYQGTAYVTALLFLNVAALAAAWFLLSAGNHDSVLPRQDANRNSFRQSAIVYLSGKSVESGRLSKLSAAPRGSLPRLRGWRLQLILPSHLQGARGAYEGGTRSGKVCSPSAPTARRVRSHVDWFETRRHQCEQARAAQSDTTIRGSRRIISRSIV
jgi:hypothetical protein